MSDPKHPAKILIVVKGGLVETVFTDRKVDARIIIADYDARQDDENYSGFGKDHKGSYRALLELDAIVDTAAVRNILNKKGGNTR